MAAPALGRLAEARGLLPASEGHATTGTRAPSVPTDAIKAFADRVAAALDASRATGRENGFLAYAAADPGAAPYVTEDDAEGDAETIAWHWRHPEATVAFSFHTHPGGDALCMPSGMDIVGALIRGDHVVYIATSDGRVTGWRFREPSGHARALVDTLLALSDAGRLDAKFVAFLYDATDTMRHDLMERVYVGYLVDGALRKTRPRRS